MPTTVRPTTAFAPRPLPVTRRLSSSSLRSRSSLPSLCCRIPGPDRLPSDAYTTLGVDDTPMCRVITSLRSSSSLTSMTTSLTANASSSASSAPDMRTSTRVLADLVDAGFRTVDLPAQSESLEPFRAYTRLVGRSTVRALHLCTRVSVHPATLSGPVRRSVVEAVVDAELARIGAEQIHLFQLAWHDLRDTRYVDFLGELQELKQGGKLRSVGTVDFPTAHLQHVLSQQISIASNAVSFSLVDSRASRYMAECSRSSRVALLATQSVAAGFIQERFIGLPEPSKKACSSSPDLLRLAAIIRLWGGWSLFQELLYAVKYVADKYEVSMPNVAIKWALQQPAFSSVVVDAGLRSGGNGGGSGGDYVVGNGCCLDTVQAFQFSLDEEDQAVLEAVLQKGNDLHHIIGDCGDELQPQGRPMQSYRNQ